MDDAHPELVADHLTVSDIFLEKTGSGVENLIG